MDRKTLGQLFLVGFKGERPDPGNWILRVLKKFDLGGVILFDKNINGSIQNFSSPASLKSLVKELRYSTEGTIFIAVDQEGGRVCRLKSSAGFKAVCSAYEMGQGGEQKIREQAAVIAEILKENGINLNFAPVVDLNVNESNPIIGKYNRSFGKSPEDVARNATWFIEEHEKHNIGCCIKHFPGHGSSTSDSHKGFVDITDCWQDIELEPYDILIKSGYKDGIMTGHLVNRYLDESGLPATLSRKIVYNILRRRYNFEGVIFSDDLQMAALTNGWTYRQSVQLAVIAGVDILVIGNNLQYNEQAVEDGVDAIEELLDKGVIQLGQINQSIDRILKFKKRLQ